MRKLAGDQAVSVPSPIEATVVEPSPETAIVADEPFALHFGLAPEDVKALAQGLEKLTGERAMGADFQTILLDTPDHAIIRQGMVFGLRRRLVRGRGGWKRLAEPLSPATPRSARGSFKRLLRHAAAIDVRARIATKRRFWLLHFGNCRVEIRVDQMIARLPEKQLEVASASFSASAPHPDFLAFMQKACDPERLRLSAETDLQRIDRQTTDQAAPYAEAFAPQLHRDMDAGAAFQAIAAACFDHFLVNEAAIRATGDHEAVHQCRVALRRLSAALRFFDKIVQGDERDSLLAAMRDIHTHLRNARDLDVMIETIIGPAVMEGGVQGAKTLLHEVEARRQAAHADLAALLCRSTSAALFLRFAIWLRAGDWTRNTDAKSRKLRSMPIVSYAQRRFAALNAKFLLACAALPDASAEDRHRTRLRAKNIRYDAEFMESLVRGAAGEKRLRAFVKSVKELQTVLGDWNDVLMARAFLSSFVGDVPQGEASDAKHSLLAGAAATLAAHHLPIEEDAFRNQSRACYQALLDSKPFWTKLG